MVTTFRCLLVFHMHGLGDVTTSPAIPAASLSEGTESDRPLHLADVQGLSLLCVGAVSAQQSGGKADFS